MISIHHLVWDVWNIAHIACHQISPEEVEEVCAGVHIERQAHSGRIMVIGQSAAHRMLSVILVPEDEEGVYYPVTARPASRKERRIYRMERGGAQE